MSMRKQTVWTFLLSAFFLCAGGSVWAEEPTAEGEEATPEPFVLPPSIHIGGRNVMQYLHESRVQDVKVELPEALRDLTFRKFFMRRKGFEVPPYAPHRGPNTSEVAIVEFSDPGCVTCQDDMKEFEKILEKSKILQGREEVPITRIIKQCHIYAASEAAGPLGLAAFYARVAERLGKFWEYREQIIHAKNMGEQDYFTLLVETGVPMSKIRTVAIHDSRQIYRELDADALKVEEKGFPNAPFWLVNGILVSKNYGVPLHLLDQVIAYEIQRQDALHLQSPHMRHKDRTEKGY